jgi:hypothetical protein
MLSRSISCPLIEATATVRCCEGDAPAVTYLAQARKREDQLRNS